MQEIWARRDVEAIWERANGPNGPANRWCNVEAPWLLEKQFPSSATTGGPLLAWSAQTCTPELGLHKRTLQDLPKDLCHEAEAVFKDPFKVTR